MAALGIDLSKIDESYTTQTCPVCGRQPPARVGLNGYRKSAPTHGQIKSKYRNQSGNQ
ncbi:zinc ribbon domain-containing protein [Desulfoscipio geothermicus]|uniref:zinc ribbon domain-containing protein n=1 Tax=Desulfoscipio geothermicus TaxID=39060 RepID=UPI003CCB7F19